MMELYNGQLNKIHFNVQKAKKENVSTDILTFDIETTNAFLTKDNHVIPYTKGKSEEYWNELTPLSICYIWQFSFNDKVYYGRTLEGFKAVLDDLPTDINFIIWVHNLSFEFQYLRNFLHFDKVFARTKRKPIYAECSEYPNVTFRCSYTLTRLSLDSWGKQLGCFKLTGYLDYQKLRTPLTKLTDKELQYAGQDCIVVYEGIKTYIKRYGLQTNIPLTQTGTVRREVKKRLWTKEYSSFIKKLLPRNAEEYHRLKSVFAGGYTHANRYYSGDTVRGHIEHYDFTSSYPTVMVCEKYPMTPWKYIPKIMTELPTETDAEDTAFLMELRFTNIDCCFFNTYIQSAKCTGRNIKRDNGRVISADEITLWVTEQDYFTIKETYDYDNVEILSMYTSKKEYLPKIFIDYILELYGNKTRLKGVDGEEDLYLQSKQYINSMYGMMVTSFIQSCIEYDGEWKEVPITSDDVEDKIKEIKSKFWDSTYFLSYSWGCWVTAYARRNLWVCIEQVDHGDGIEEPVCLYSDTDSIFALGHCDFTEYNNTVTEKLRKVCEFYNIDFEKTRPKTIKGKEKPLGIFDKESDIEAFRTLGAKRYVEQRLDHKLYMTVSGVNKEGVECLDGDIENFKEGIVFDKDSGYIDENGNKHGCYKNLCYYCDNQPEVTFPDGFKSTYKYGICLRPNGYKLTISDDYKDIMEMFDFTTDTAPEPYINFFKSRFIDNNKKGI